MKQEDKDFIDKLSNRSNTKHKEKSETKVESTRSQHKGHRQRLKDKVREFGFDILKEHEVMELLLMYSIPYKNTNDIAHDLINKYGDLWSAIKADINGLQQVKGVGKETALFFGLISYIRDNYKAELIENKIDSLQTTQQMVAYFRQNFSVEKNNEALYIVFLNSKHKVVNVQKIQGEQNDINIDTTELNFKLAMSKTKTVVLYHTHTNGIAKPSREDIKTTEQIMRACYALKIRLVEHLIITDYNYFSFRNAGIIDQISKSVIDSLNQNSSTINLTTEQGKDVKVITEGDDTYFEE